MSAPHLIHLKDLKAGMEVFDDSSPCLGALRVEQDAVISGGIAEVRFVSLERQTSVKLFAPVTSRRSLFQLLPKHGENS